MDDAAGVRSGTGRAGETGDEGDGGFLGAGVGVEVVGGGFEVGVAEEFLDGADIHAVLDEAGGNMWRSLHCVIRFSARGSP